MTHKLPLTLASILISLCLSGCFDNGQSAGTNNSPPTVASPAPSETANKVSESTEPVMLKGPNAIPKDTRIVVNIPAFRMDVFQDGALLRSFKIGIGYQQYPLPTGFRKAEQIIFNPTWTQPNEPWASDPGAITPAGAAGNPLGPIKVPIGGANLIHGGKSLAKIGTFASHGCVGLTNDEVRDFVRTLADATKIELTDDTIAGYMKHRTRTQVVKIPKAVPVELRYETIVIQDGQLHVYRDVYNKNTNSEENLRAAFEANGLSFDKLSEEEKTQALNAVNAMSLRPKKPAPAKPIPANLSAEEKKAALAERREAAQKEAKLRSQKESVIDLTELAGKGYPSPKDLHSGAGTIASNTGAPPLKPKPARSPDSPDSTSPRPGATPAAKPSSVASQAPRSSPSP